MKLRDNFWIWGHPTNSLLNSFGIDRKSDMPPVEGTYYLGATKTFLVPMGRPCDRKAESELACDIAEIGWSIELAKDHPENVTEVCELSKTYKNISRGIFHDFFSPSNEANNFKNYTPEMIRGYRKELNAAGLELWCVLYTENFRQTDMETIQSFLDEFDGISLWFWNEKEVLEDYDKYIDIFLKVARDKKRLVGCYIYDFGAAAPATSKAVIYQLEKAREMIKNGDIGGVILHTNAVVAAPGEEPYEAVETCVSWMKENGDEEI